MTFLIFFKKKGFDSKRNIFNKKVTSNKLKHVEAEKKPTKLTKKVAQVSEKGYYYF